MIPHRHHFYRLVLVTLTLFSVGVHLRAEWTIENQWLYPGKARANGSWVNFLNVHPNGTIWTTQNNGGQIAITEFSNNGAVLGQLNWAGRFGGGESTNSIMWNQFGGPSLIGSSSSGPGPYFWGTTDIDPLLLDFADGPTLVNSFSYQTATNNEMYFTERLQLPSGNFLYSVSSYNYTLSRPMGALYLFDNKQRLLWSKSFPDYEAPRLCPAGNDEIYIVFSPPFNRKGELFLFSESQGLTSICQLSELIHLVTSDGKGGFFTAACSRDTYTAAPLLAQHYTRQGRTWLTSLTGSNGTFTLHSILADSKGGLVVQGQGYDNKSVIMLVRLDEAGQLNWSQTFRYQNSGEERPVGLYEFNNELISIGWVKIPYFVFRPVINRYSLNGQLQKSTVINSDLTTAFTPQASSIDTSGCIYIAGQGEISNTYYSHNLLLRVSSQDQLLSETDFTPVPATDAWSTEDDLIGSALTPDGNFVFAGNSASPDGGDDMWIFKIDPNGQKLWERFIDDPAISGISTENLRSMCVDDQGSTFVVGLNGTSDSLIVSKIDPDGNILWTQYQATDGFYDFPICSDGEGGLYLANTKCGGPVINGNTPLPNIQVIRYDLNGSLLWESTYNGPANKADYPKGLQLDEDGNLHVYGTVEASSTSRDLLLLKYAPDGNQTLSVNIPRLYEDDGTRMCLASNGTKYLAGYGFTGSAKVCFLYKIDATGNILWNRTFQGPVKTADEPLALAPLSDGGLLLMVSTLESKGASYYNLMLIRIDPDGNELWRTVYNSGGSKPGPDIPTDWLVDDLGNALILNSTGGLQLLWFNMNGTLVDFSSMNGVSANQPINPRSIMLHPTKGLYTSALIKGPLTNFDPALLKMYRNRSPVLLNQTIDLGSIEEDTITPLTIQVADLLDGLYTDPDGDPPFGIALETVYLDSGYSEIAYDGSTWEPLPWIHFAHGLMLPFNAAIRFYPNGLQGGNATIRYRCWDGTDHAFIPVGVQKQLFPLHAGSSISQERNSATFSIKENVSLVMNHGTALFPAHILQNLTVVIPNLPFDNPQFEYFKIIDLEGGIFTSRVDNSTLTVGVLINATTAATGFNFYSSTGESGHITLQPISNAATGTVLGSPFELLANVLLNDIQAWRFDLMGNAHNEGDFADAADFDRDGVCNLEEFAFGLDPTQPTHRTVDPEHSNKTGLPAFKATWLNNQIDLKFFITKLISNGSLDYQVMFSSSPEGPWQQIPKGTGPGQYTIDANEPTGDGNTTFMQITLLPPVGHEQAGFYKIQVTNTQP